MIYHGQHVEQLIDSSLPLVMLISSNGSYQSRHRNTGMPNTTYLKNFMVFFEADFPLETISSVISRVELAADFPFAVAVCPTSFAPDTTDFACDEVVDATDFVPFLISETIDLLADVTEFEVDLAVFRADFPIDWTVLLTDLVAETPLSTVSDTVFFTFLNMMSDGRGLTGRKALQRTRETLFQESARGAENYDYSAAALGSYQAQSKPISFRVGGWSAPNNSAAIRCRRASPQVLRFQTLRLWSSNSRDGGALSLSESEIEKFEGYR